MKHNAMIVGLAAAILLTLDGGALVRAATEPTKDHCAGISEAFLVTGFPSGYCNVASTNKLAGESLMALSAGIPEAFVVTGFPPGYYR